MLKKHTALLSVATMLGVLLGASGKFAIVLSWSNGGFSEHPSNPDYGTHDWIAEHALDWLPLGAKQFILENKQVYLYGTELADNGGVQGGIGDTRKHHVYYFPNGSLEENDSAVRAQQEYNSAVNLYHAGDLAGAAKELGIMAHYISDLASFGHVMGSRTEWGNATHHDQYEDCVNSRTDSYYDELNTFLNFDGDWNNISAYDAALTLAHDTTFDDGGGLTCVWMENSYNWSDITFMNRCAESLNLAVNLIADVLHAFYVQEVGPELPTSTIALVFTAITLIIIISVKKRAPNSRLNKKVHDKPQ